MATKKKTTKNTNKNNKIGGVPATVVISILTLIVGFIVGYIAPKVLFVTEDVKYTLIGSSTVNVGQNSTYNESGVTLTIKGEDVSSDVITKYYDLSGSEIESISTTNLGSYYVKYIYNKDGYSVSTSRLINIVEFDDLEINFMMLGNDAAGDAIYIKAGETDILIDAGSKANSATTILNYINGTDTSVNHKYITDDKIEFVIATHGDQDHIAAFPGVLSKYKTGVIIDSPYSNKTTATFKNYKAQVEKEVSEGAKHYTSLECFNNQNGAQRVYDIGVGITMEILYNYYFENETSNENDYSVCVLITRGTEKFLLNGDLEEAGESKMVDYYSGTDKLDNVYLYKAAHHGSKTSSSDKLMNVINPKVVVCSCCAFTHEYTTNDDNTFPTKKAVDAYAANGVEHFYVTSMVSTNSAGWEPANGNVVVYATISDGVGVRCSQTMTDFYEFDIFKTYRSWIK